MHEPRRFATPPNICAECGTVLVQHKVLDWVHKHNKSFLCLVNGAIRIATPKSINNGKVQLSLFRG